MSKVLRSCASTEADRFAKRDLADEAWRIVDWGEGLECLDRSCESEIFRFKLSNKDFSGV